MDVQDQLPAKLNCKSCHQHRRKLCHKSEGAHGKRGFRAYSGDLGAEPTAGCRGRAPGEGLRGQSPHEAESIFVFQKCKLGTDLPIFVNCLNVLLKDLLHFCHRYHTPLVLSLLNQSEIRV